MTEEDLKISTAKLRLDDAQVDAHMAEVQEQIGELESKIGGFRNQLLRYASDKARIRLELEALFFGFASGGAPVKQNGNG